MRTPCLTALGSVLLLGLAVCLAGAGPEPPAAAGPVLYAIDGPLPAGVAAMLVRTTAFHGDFGSMAIGEASPPTLAELGRRDLRVVALGGWPAGMDLIVTDQPDAAAAEPLPAGARVLHTAAGQALVAVPAGALDGIARHCGALVSRQAFVAGTGFAALPGGAAATVAVDPRIAQVVAGVSASNLLATVTQLSSYFTRRADSALVLQARDWIVSQVQALPGWTVSTQTFSGSYGPNIIAQKLGTLHPERIVVLGAHYDSINHSGPALQAPGADDNASGSAGVLEAARVLSAVSFENTVRCVWFCAEEEGLIGSEAYAALLDGQNAQVEAMLNMDMIAHLEPGDAYDLDFATNNTDAALTQFCRDVGAAYVPGLPTVTGVLSAGSSDHASFTLHGFPAAFLFEDLTGFSHALHTAADALPASPNNFTLAHDITQACVAAAATLATPVDMTITHVPLGDTTNGSGPYPLQASVVSNTPASVVSVQAAFTVNGGSPQSVPLLHGSAPGQWVGSLPATSPLANVRYWLISTDSAGNQQWLPDALSPGAASFAFLVANVTTIVADGFEGPTDNGWTHSTPGGVDDWQRGVPQGKAGDPAAASQGGAVWGNDLGSGSDGSYTPNVDCTLHSPVIDCSGRTGVHLRYSRWLTIEEGVSDHASLAVNGAMIWQNPAVGNLLDTAWTPQDLDISALADNNPSVQLGFRLQSEGFFQLGGWNVDDVRLVSLTAGDVAPLAVSKLHLSAAAGGALNFALDAGPAHAGRKYVLAMSASGSAPGTHVGSVIVPLNFDAVSALGFQFANTALLPGTAGLLSAQGTAQAGFVSPPLGGTAMIGVHLSFAFFTLGPIDYASNAVAVEYVP